MTTSKDEVDRLHNAADDAYLAWQNAPTGKIVELWQQYEDAATAYLRAKGQVQSEGEETR